MKSKENFDFFRDAENFIQKYGFDKNEIDKILSFCDLHSYSKGVSFIKEGSVSNKIGILLCGMLFAYTTNDLGEKNISRFFFKPENVIVTNFECFILNIKSNETIESFSDSVILTITKDNLYRLYESIPELNRIGRALAEDSYIKALKKIKILQQKEAKERIKILQEQSPELFQQLPRSYIASYLGMHRNTYNKAMSSLY